MGRATTGYAAPDTTISAARKMVASRGAIMADFGEGVKVNLDRSAWALSLVIGDFGSTDTAAILMYQPCDEWADAEFRFFAASAVENLFALLRRTALQDRLIGTTNESAVYPYAVREMQSEPARTYLAPYAAAFQDFVADCAKTGSGMILVTA